jgi:hypothetical protein
MLPSEFDNYQLRLLSRWYALRKQGKLYPILQQGLLMYTFTCLADPWGSGERLTWDRLRQDVEAAEAVIVTVKKPPASEPGNQELTVNTCNRSA